MLAYIGSLAAADPVDLSGLLQTIERAPHTDELGNVEQDVAVLIGLHIINRGGKAECIQIAGLAVQNGEKLPLN